MSGAGKKYNIWIAYSDLFTNLSTFLFISALGVFAAFGSGAFGVGSASAEKACPAASTVGAILTMKSDKGDPSLLRELPLDSRQTDRRGNCTEYYALRDYRFHRETLTPSLREFRKGDTQELTPAGLQAGLCEQVWLTLADTDFDKAHGRVTIVGIGVADTASAYQRQCYAARLSERSIDEFPRELAGRALRPSQVVTACKREAQGGKRAFPICPRVLVCLEKEAVDREDWCQDVAAADLRARQANVACGRLPAQLQAKTLFDICEGAPDDPRFPTQRFRKPGKVESALMPDTRRALWESVTFDGAVRDGGGAPRPGSTPLDSLPAGSIAVKVQYDP